MMSAQPVSMMPQRFAWLGRVSTEDQQDPTLSLPRQLHNSEAGLPPGARIVARFFDIESGRMDLSLRGRGSAHEHFDIPIDRDGGIQDLLEEASSPGCRFDAVICESIERVARRTYYGTKIEHDLERANVSLWAADEPMSANGKRATTILARRVKQSVSEWVVLDMLEKSWDGYCEHTRQGWNIGVPPYGFVAQRVPHPVPAKRAEGKTKTKLELDPLRAPVVCQIYCWRVEEALGYGEIAQRLNQDLTQYPPPRSLDPGRRTNQWSSSSVREILLNPKYTGHMVWNRRASKKGGRVNPPSAWVWSPEPTHDAIIDRDLFEAAQRMTSRSGSRRDSGLNRHPATKRSYLLRSYVICTPCGTRMFGKTTKGTPSYVCQPSKNHGRSPTDGSHPSTIYVREDALLTGIEHFFSERVFGPQREQLLGENAKRLSDLDAAQREVRQQNLRLSVEQIDAKQRRLIATLEDEDDPRGVLAQRVRERLRELEGERGLVEAELQQIATALHESSSPELLKELPKTLPSFLELPEDLLRQLFDAFRLEIHYEKSSNLARCRVTVTGDTLNFIKTAKGLALEDGKHKRSNLQVVAVADARRVLPRARSSRATSCDSTTCDSASSKGS